MKITGQGPKIMLSTMPFVLAGILMQIYFPSLAAVPFPRYILTPIALLLLVIGVGFWATALGQLLIYFPNGKLVKNGAYGVCRNPIYSSFAFFILPAISFATATWVYCAAAVFLCINIAILIKKEEADLLRIFGNEYIDYAQRVSRIVPLPKIKF